MVAAGAGRSGRTRRGSADSGDRLSALQLAYADPPYPGRAHLYADHLDYAGEVDHVELVARLVEYDGWALSTSSKALRYVLGLCPEDVRVLVWVKNTVRYAWEPVIVSPARTPDGTLRDWMHAEPEAYQWRPKPDSYVIGQKPEAFCLWLFAWLGAEPQDALADLFLGSGAVTRAWERWRSQPVLPIARSAAAEGRAARRSRERALTVHPALVEDDAA